MKSPWRVIARTALIWAAIITFGLCADVRWHWPTWDDVISMIILLTASFAVGALVTAVTRRAKKR